MTTEEMKTWLSEKLGRSVEVNRVKVAGVEHFLVDYINHYAPVSKLVSDTEDGAIANLFSYLKSLESAPTEAETKE